MLDRSCGTMILRLLGCLSSYPGNRSVACRGECVVSGPGRWDILWRFEGSGPGRCERWWEWGRVPEAEWSWIELSPSADSKIERRWCTCDLAWANSFWRSWLCLIWGVRIAQWQSVCRTLTWYSTFAYLSPLWTGISHSYWYILCSSYSRWRRTAYISAELQSREARAHLHFTLSTRITAWVLSSLSISTFLPLQTSGGRAGVRINVWYKRSMRMANLGIPR